MKETIRLTTAQAIVRFLDNQYVAMDGVETKFVEGFLQNYGLENEISSPTFNIVNEYSSSDTSIYHFDVYRLEDSDEFYAIGGEEYFENGICLIEWGELISDALPKDYIHIIIDKDSNNENLRVLNFEVNDDSKYVDVLNKLNDFTQL